MVQLRADAPRAKREDDRDQCVVLHRVPWAMYQALTDLYTSGGAGARIAYLDGELELMSPGHAHMHIQQLLSRLVEVWADEHDFDFNGAPQYTLREQKEQAGAEPDECYYLGGRDAEKEFPDLAIEVVVTSGGIDKLEIYRRLGVGEVWFWFWGEDRLRIYTLESGAYRAVERSRLLPDLDIDQINEIVRTTEFAQQSAAVRRFRDALRARR